MKISKSEQTPALGAAIFGAVSAGEGTSGFKDISYAQKVMTGLGNVFNPIKENHMVYKKLYSLYRQLHDGFGTKSWSGNMYNVMKDLLDIRDQVNKEE